MVRRSSSQASVDNRLLAAMIVILVLNTLVVGTGFYFFSREVRGIQSSSDRNARIDEIIRYNNQLAADLQVNDLTSVKQSIASFQYEMQLADSGSELTRIIVTQGSKVQDTILQERELKLKDNIVLLVNREPGISEIEERTVFSLSISKEGILTDPNDLLDFENKEEIMALFMSNELEQKRTLDLEVLEGQAKIKSPRDPLEVIGSLESEVAELRQTLLQVQQESGFAEMNGEGVEIKIFDAEEGLTETAIVHDADVRQVVNDLFTSGARGISVGGQRLIATSNIRCNGPIINVNNIPIDVNPVVIRAVGDSAVLDSAMDLIKVTFAAYRGLRIEVEQINNMTVPAYSRK